MTNEKQKTLDILVVDDNALNRQSAKDLLSEHNTTVVATAEEALKLLDGRWAQYDDPKQAEWLGKADVENGRPRGDRMWCINPAGTKAPYDVFLTDLMITEEAYDNRIKRSVTSEQPLGYPLIFFAAQKMVPYVGLVTSANHHQGSMARTIDMFPKEPMIVSGSKVLLRNASSAYQLKNGLFVPAPQYDSAKETSEERKERHEMEQKLFMQNENGNNVRAKNWKSVLDELVTGQYKR